MLKRFLRQLFSTDASLEEQYLAASINLVDLENRMRQIERKEAPFQKRFPTYM